MVALQASGESRTGETLPGVLVRVQPIQFCYRWWCALLVGGLVVEEVTMCAEAWMASYLMEVGWELHVNSNPDVTPSLIKGETIGNTTTFTSEPISHDAVIDLLTKSKSVEKRCEFSAEGFRQSIYHWVK